MTHEASENDHVKWLRAEADMFDELGEPESYEHGARLFAIADELAAKDAELGRVEANWRALVTHTVELEALVDELIAEPPVLPTARETDWIARARRLRDPGEKM